MEYIGWTKDIKYLVFDLDGTLIDSEKLYVRFWVEAGRHFGYPMETQHAMMLRSLTHEVAEPLMRKEVAPDFDFFKVRAYRMEIMEAYVEREGVEPKPFMKETLEWFHEKGYKIALATANQEEKAKSCLERQGILPLFDALATRDMVRHGKPAPDIYQLAIEKLGGTPAETVAVEDSPTGIRAAAASGAHAVMIPDLDQPDEEIRKICTVLPSLRALREIFEQK